MENKSLILNKIKTYIIKWSVTKRKWTILESKNNVNKIIKSSVWFYDLTLHFLMYVLPEIVRIISNNNQNSYSCSYWCRSSHPEVFLVKGVLKICGKFTGEHLCRSCFATLLKSHFDMGVSCKFAAYFQNTFSWEYLWKAASGVLQS